MRINLILLILLLWSTSLLAQTYTREDSIRGSITPERAWWDLQHYDLEVKVYPQQQYISGTNVITFKTISTSDKMQIDLQAPMQIDSVVYKGQIIKVTNEASAHYLELPEIDISAEDQVTIYWSGEPKVAVRPPWDGGWTWQQDSNGKAFIATSNQGIGSSVWWPNKDHPADEPDKGVDLKINVPAGLTAVGNGRLLRKWEAADRITYHWKVVNPINNYGVNVNIGDYVNFQETYAGEAGNLDLDYWVLRENEEKAREQFKQTPMMMKAFEHWFGPYPFYEDSFKLVEVPYLGMEHQSSVTYGNGYQNGYRGTDLSGSGWGLKFDFIIIHEAGHEWFANNITNTDVADMWIHEGFTAYSENLYLDYYHGTDASADYVIGTRRNIQNQTPIIGDYGVARSGGNDMYYKGANMLHTLRQLVEDDEKWRQMLRGLNKEFYHQTVSSKQVEDYLSAQKGADLSSFFDQYLRTSKIPVLNYSIEDKTLEFYYENIIEGFDMPVIALINGEEQWIFPKATLEQLEWKETIEKFEIKRDFYINSENHKKN
ncbi:M1 family metallopeptidase [Aureitalea marina]|uniref:Peptidase M1 n=1 Tax=Aureitalea marina TaxID=930804 RepID=A0A2S7KPW5_9FLAO|nr:M1 family metallopeptidase [Aureitalea marina]PQB04613.1 peptidase M1 [Aureitalea marina]